MKISIVIYSKNQRQTTLMGLSSLASQTFPYLDLCIVDDGSEDGLRFDVRKHTSRFLHYIFVPNVGFKSAILSGLHQVAGDVLLIASGNTWFGARFLETFSSYLGKRDFGGVVGNAFEKKCKK